MPSRGNVVPAAAINGRRGGMPALYWNGIFQRGRVMVQDGKAAVRTAATGEVSHSRHEDPIEGRLSIRRWYDLSSRLPGQLSAKSINGLDTRRFLEAVLWVAATDSTWSQLPKSYGNFHIVYQRFVRWTKLDVWDLVCSRLQGDARLPALQRLVRLEREIQQRRHIKTAETTRKTLDANTESAERLHALEARVEKMEALLAGLLEASPTNPA